MSAPSICTGVAMHNEILTVGNHADGVYLYLKAQEQDPLRAGKILDLLRMNGGNNSGIRIARSMTRATFIPTSFGGTIHW